MRWSSAHSRDACGRRGLRAGRPRCTGRREERREGAAGKASPAARDVRSFPESQQARRRRRWRGERGARPRPAAQGDQGSGRREAEDAAAVCTVTGPEETPTGMRSAHAPLA
ncbi:hypothetical protein NDU88_008071 [Pleurodeles waltl]|uniref:Uncharacterized protein n=1 Tax=Pleurodeles waltl TaxID=8319 RepID=A0AAV7RS40_PLEWA|nr:hypothetical protein NDU88_008071 [Pleurodeles waltl]